MSLKTTNIVHSLSQNFVRYRQYIRNSDVIRKTELTHSERLSNKFGCNIWLKREDLQSVRSFKIRGAYCKIMENISNQNDNHRVVVTASAGNHAQGVALTCKSLGLDNTIFVPENTPNQKKSRIQHFALGNTGKFSLELAGTNFDECLHSALEYCEEHNGIFVHPFDDYDVIMGQSTIAQEIYEEIPCTPDYILNTVGGGGLISGVGLYSKYINPQCKIIGIEPQHANSLQLSMLNQHITEIPVIDTWVDGASVKKCGDKVFEICINNNIVDDIFTVSNEEICCDLLDIYENEGIVLEPAGIMGITGLKYIQYKHDIKNKNIVMILSGGNNDISRYPEMIEKCLKYQGLKYYFLVTFAQTPGQLRKFVNNVLNDGDDITRFEYLKKNFKEYGTVLIGIQVGEQNHVNDIMANMTSQGFKFQKLDEHDQLYSYLI